MERFVQSFVLQILIGTQKPKGKGKGNQNKTKKFKRKRVCLLLLVDAFFFFFLGGDFFSARKNGYHSISLVSQNFLHKIAIPNRLMIIVSCRFW